MFLSLHMETKVTAQVLKRYFAGHCPAAEEAMVEKWLQADPAHMDLARQWMEEDAAADEEVYAQLIADQQQVWNRISRKLPASGSTSQQYRGSAYRTSMSLAWKVAASLSGIVLLALGVYLFQLNRKVVITSGYGKVRTITLPDLSVVYLNGNSTLRYAAEWQAHKREVWLEGEAFFDVRHQEKGLHFTVHLSGKTDIEVLGTEFNVSDRQAGKSIVLQSGKIKLHFEEGKTLWMQPGDLIKMTSGTIHKTKVNPGQYSSWTTGKWILEGTSLAQMLEQLKETYGITAMSQDTSVLNKKASGSIPLPPAGDGSLLVGDIADLFDLQVSQSNGIIYFSAN